MKKVLLFGMFVLLIFPVAFLSSEASQGPVASEDEFLLNTLWDHYRALPKRHDLKVGLALSGGGARGLAHIGVLKVFQEEDIPVDMIAGNSVGALIGALYAAGVSPSEMEEMSKEIGWPALTNFSQWSLVRLLMTEQKLSSENMEVYLRRWIGEKRFDQLKIPFACSATDLQTGERIVFREGSVAFAARASATIPGLFSPVPFRHRFLVDGGLVSNIPTDLVALLGAQVIIAIAVVSDFTHTKPSTIFSTMNQALYIQSEALSERELARADFVVSPQLPDISATDLGRTTECVDAGILAAQRAAPGIKRLIIDKNFDLIVHRDPRHGF